MQRLEATCKLLAGSFNGSLSSSQTGDGNTEGRAADVVQTNIVAELNAGGVAAVLAADAQTQVRLVARPSAAAS